MEEKAKATIYINETCAQIDMERHDVEVYRKCLQAAEELMAKHIAEYVLRKQELTSQVSGMIYFFQYRIIYNLEQEIGNNVFVLIPGECFIISCVKHWDKNRTGASRPFEAS